LIYLKLTFFLTFQSTFHCYSVAITRVFTILTAKQYFPLTGGYAMAQALSTCLFGGGSVFSPGQSL